MMNILKISLLFLANLFFTISSAQQSLSKKEIYENWVKSTDLSESYDKIVRNLSNDNEINSHIRTAMEDLRKEGADTLLLLINSYPGLFTRDSCRGTMYPSDVYIFWELAGVEHMRRIPNKCGFGDAEMQCSSIFDFYNQNKEQIKQEYIMPVILSATMVNDQTKYTREVENHENAHTIFYYINGEYKKFTFSNGDISNKKSIFYDDNRKTNVYMWFLLMERKSRILEGLTRNK